MPGSGTLLGNPRGTLMKQADKNRTGLLKAEIWARSGEDVGRIWDPNETHIAYWQPTWDPYETGGQKPYGPHMDCSLQRTTLMKAVVSAAARRCASL